MPAVAEKKKKSGDRKIAKNSKAFHDYFVEDSYEAGIELAGTEVKSIRLGQCNLKDCYAQVKNGELWVYGMHISPYEQGNIFNRDPLRPKKLLAHKMQIRKLNAQQMQEGLTLVPLSIYLSDGLVKLELGVCKGKKNYDKRDAMQERDTQREMQRAMRDSRRSDY